MLIVDCKQGVCKKCKSVYEAYLRYTNHIQRYHFLVLEIGPVTSIFSDSRCRCHRQDLSRMAEGRVLDSLLSTSSPQSSKMVVRHIEERSRQAHRRCTTEPAKIDQLTYQHRSMNTFKAIDDGSRCFVVEKLVCSCVPGMSPRRNELVRETSSHKLRRSPELLCVRIDCACFDRLQI